MSRLRRRLRAALRSPVAAAVVVIAGGAGGGCSDGSNPSELAHERGAVELVRAWPCAGGGTLGALVGGDLKTDWTAHRQGDGVYSVRMSSATASRTFVVHLGERRIEPTSVGARDDVTRCTSSR